MTEGKGTSVTNTYFTADTHFGHENILHWSSRPFESVEAMDETLVANWNETVGPRDRVFVLGDFGLTANAKQLQRLLGIRRRLRGQIILVRGNHDRSKSVRELRFADVHRLLDVKVDGQRVVMCHYAMRTWPGSHQGAWHLYGHSHGLLQGLFLSFDVGVDCWDYAPVSWERIKLEMKDRVAPPSKSPVILDTL